MNLQEKLEEFKQVGMYGVCCYFGEDVGCDDSEVPLNDRNFKVIAYPVGVLGEAKVFYKGTVGSFLDFNVKSKPMRISNPPNRPEYDNDGYYAWGTDDAMETILSRKA